MTLFIPSTLLCSKFDFSDIQGHCKGLFSRTISGTKHCIGQVLDRTTEATVGI